MNSLIVWGVGFKSYLKMGCANHSASIITIINSYIGVVILFWSIFITKKITIFILII